MINKFYALHDYDESLKKKGAFPVKYEDLEKYNKLGYAIYWTPNDFDGDRKAKNLIKINFWIADIDEGSKEGQMQRIKALALKPSKIIETKKGFHCYWTAEDATIENYKDIECGIIEKLKADKACKDVCRLLRFPNYYHLKDPDNPFLVRCIYNSDEKYKESEMLFTFRLPKQVYNVIHYDGDKQDFVDETKWEQIFKLNMISEGGRNNRFSEIAYCLSKFGFSKDVVMNSLLRMNQKIKRPLDEWEIKTIVNGKF